MTESRTPRSGSLRWVAALLALLALAAWLYRGEISRLSAAADLFEPDRIVHNFQNMDELFDARVIGRSDDILEFDRGHYALPTSFEHRGRSYDTEAFLEQLVTTGLIIVQDDTILYERYAHGHEPAGQHIAWSVSKSFVSALFGIAVDEGHFPDLSQPVSEILPELVGSGYDGVPIEHVLEMSSGVRFNEDYGDPFSDINRMGPAMAAGSLLDFAATLETEQPSGTVLHYVSVDTQVLGEMLVRATGQDLASYAAEKLWQPLGMEFDAYFLLDGAGREWAFGGLNASLRDFARFGWLYAHGGSRHGHQIVPRAWVEASVTASAPHLEPGREPGSAMGYGYQWWIPGGSQGEFTALGVYGQNIWVDPAKHLVIAKNSADVDFQKDDFENGQIAISLWRTIAAELSE